MKDSSEVNLKNDFRHYVIYNLSSRMVYVPLIFICKMISYFWTIANALRKCYNLVYATVIPFKSIFKCTGGL